MNYRLWLQVEYVDLDTGAGADVGQPEYIDVGQDQELALRLRDKLPETSIETLQLMTGKSVVELLDPDAQPEQQRSISEKREAFANVTAALESMLAHFWQMMPEADREQREKVLAIAKEILAEPEHRDDFGACGNRHCRGYDAFLTGREPACEIQCCDACTDRGDDWAAIQFVRDLENGNDHAKRTLHGLLNPR